MSNTNEFFERWVKSQKRIVVFAGVFDPVHKGHLQAAKDALRFGSRIVVLPERAPWHKHSTTEYSHRLAMLQAAVEKYSNIDVIDYPEDKHYIEPFFTWLSKQYPDYAFSWMIGSDVADHIADWPGAEKLSSLGVDQIIIASRKGMVKDHPLRLPGIRVKYLKTRNHHMSSSYIREDIKTRHTALPQEAQAYIKEHKLYV